jgi:hypothetical protein
MYETYPKGGKRMLGEQTAKTFVSANGAVQPEYQQVGSKTSYPAKGHAGPNTRHKSSEQSRKPFLTAGGNKMVTASYPAKSHSAFGSEKAANKLKPPMSCQPKKA